MFFIKKLKIKCNILQCGNEGLNCYERNKEKILEWQKKYNKEHQLYLII